MSRAAHGESKRARQQCESCHARKARFRYGGVVKADRDHTLCFECFRAERDRCRARLLAGVPPPRPLRLTLPIETSRTAWQLLRDDTSDTRTDVTAKRDFAAALNQNHCRVRAPGV